MHDRVPATTMLPALARLVSAQLHADTRTPLHGRSTEGRVASQCRCARMLLLLLLLILLLLILLLRLRWLQALSDGWQNAEARCTRRCSSRGQITKRACQSSALLCWPARRRHIVAESHADSTHKSAPIHVPCNACGRQPWLIACAHQWLHVA